MRISDWSSDVCSSDLKVLEDPWEETPDYVYSRTVNPEDAPDAPEYITVDFERGDGVALNGQAMSPATLLAALNDLGRKHGIGRRSDEHTSELQSLMRISYAVFCLKKKT